MNSVVPALKTIVRFLAVKKDKAITGFLTAKRDYVILTSLYIFHLITTYVWLKLDTLPLTVDAGKQYLRSLVTYDTLGLHSFLDVLNPLWLRHLPELLHVSQSFWPPFSTAVITPFYTIFGKAPDTAALIQYAVFYLILIFSVYGIGRRLFSRNAGLLAAFLVTMYPVITLFIIHGVLVQPGKIINLDIPVAAMVSLSLYALLLTEHFKNTRYSVLFGIALGLGWLTKFHFPIFVAGPIVLVAITSMVEVIKRKEPARNLLRFNRQMPNMIYSLAALALVAGPYWNVNRGTFAMYFEASIIYVRGGTVVSSLIECMTFLFFVLAMASLVYMTYLVISKSLKAESVIFLVLWLIIPWAIFSVSTFRDTRYLAPVVPATALISAVALEKIRFNKLKLASISLVVILGLVQFFGFTFGVPDLPKGRVTIPQYSGPFFPSGGEPIQQDWKGSEIVQIIREDWESLGIPEGLRPEGIEVYRALYQREIYPASQRGIYPASISVIPFTHFISMPILYYSYLHGLPLLVRFNFGTLAETYEDFADSLYILTYEDEGFWGQAGREMELCQRTHMLFQAHIDDYELVNGVKLADGSKLLVYRAKASSRVVLRLTGTEPDTDMVAITSIQPDKLSYEAGEKITVTVGLINIGDIAYEGLAWWQLTKPGYQHFAPESAVVSSEEANLFTLEAGEETKVSLAATVQPGSGSYELAVAVRVYTDEEHEKTAHSDVHVYQNKILLKGLVEITSIQPDKLSYEADEKITVTIGLKNVSDIPYEGKAWWQLTKPGYQHFAPESALVSSKEANLFTLEAGEETQVSLAATVPHAPGSYELAVGVRVFTDEEHEKTVHSDVAAYQNKIVIKGMVEITGIESDKLSYQAGETMTVTIGLKNVGDTPYEGKAWWQLTRPGYQHFAPESAVVHSEDPAFFALDAGEEVEVSLVAAVPPGSGSYELAVAVRVYTDEEHDETVHSDVAAYQNKIVIKGMVEITGIESDKLSYQAGETMTVTIGLKNVGDTPYEGKAWWQLTRPGYQHFAPESAVVHSEDAIFFTLDAGEEVEVSLVAAVPPGSGSYELAVAVRVYTDEEHDETVHSDVACQLDKVAIK